MREACGYDEERYRKILEGRTHNNLHEGHAGYPGATVGGNIPLAAVLSVLAD